MSIRYTSKQMVDDTGRLWVVQSHVDPMGVDRFEQWRFQGPYRDLTVWTYPQGVPMADCGPPVCRYRER